MKRPIVIITIGYIVGILGGLYLHIVPFILVSLVCSMVLEIGRGRCCGFPWRNKVIRFLKPFITKQVLIIFSIACFLGATKVRYLEKEYEHIYASLNRVHTIGTIVSEKQETKYYYTYKIDLHASNTGTHWMRSKQFLLQIPKTANTILQYGDKIAFTGEYEAPETQRNEGGFDYRKYLKTQHIYGMIKVKKITKVIQHKNIVLKLANSLRSKIMEQVNKLFPEETKGIFLSVTLGTHEFISEEVKDNFSKSNLSHLLAVSGMHISYLVMGMTILLQFVGVHKKVSRICTSLVLLLYLCFIDFPTSATRAVIMGVISTMAMVCHRKQDTATTLSLSSLLILMNNPYKIREVGFLLSFGGTIGIIAFLAPSYAEKLLGRMDKIKQAARVTITAQILIIPVMLYYFHTISLTFLLANLLAGIFIGPIILVGFIIIILCLIPFPFLNVLVKSYSVLIVILLKLTQVISSMPLSQIYLPRPALRGIILYMVMVFLCWMVKLIETSHRPYLKKIVARKKQYDYQIIRKNRKQLFILVICICLCVFILQQIPKDLRIHFIDVGQGDSCLVITPQQKTILVDSGGDEHYDVGKNTLHPYLLNRGITTIDYIMISHFDTDHCKGFEYVLEHMRVKHILIPKQTIKSENYQKIKSIAEEKHIPMQIMHQGKVLQLDKYSTLEVLSPIKEHAYTDMNDTSIIAKLTCYHTSILFTGDASQEIEKEVLQSSREKLKATILKVGHHGSKTSTSDEFLKAVQPKVALIGVGKHNKFGHPTQEVLNKLNKQHVKTYRTDEMGEISMTINQQGKIKIKKHISD